MSEKNFLLKSILILIAIGFTTTASAAVTEPASIKNFLLVFMEMLKGTGGQFGMVAVAIFAVFKGYQNASPLPLIWGGLVVIIIATAPDIASSLTDNASTIIDL